MTQIMRHNKLLVNAAIVDLFVNIQVYMYRHVWSSKSEQINNGG